MPTMPIPEVRDYFRKIGKRGAKATNSKLSRAEITAKMRRAAQARWAKEKKKESANV